MSSLFGSKRRRPPNQPLLTTSTAHSDAATAALSAFSRRESSPSLSEAAAAAALKARPHTPTDVSSIVPKRRSVRRSASNSSHGTASPRPPLERAGSAGSMRDRTFRSPSPHGRQSMETTNRATTRPAEYDAPPVPSIPRTVQAPQQQAPQRVGSLRIANTPVRVASQKLKDGGAKGTGTWFGAPSVGDLSNVRASDAALATTNAATAPPKDLYPRPESRSSVNFSYPSRLRLGSPPPPASMAEEYEPQQPESAAQSQARAKRSSMSTSQPTRKTSTRQRPASMSATSDMVYDPNSRRMVPRGELMARERILDDVEPRQSPKKKSSRAGSHLSKGSVSRTQAVEAVQTHPEPVLVSPVATQEYAPPSTSGYIEVQQPTADSDRPRAESEGKERAEQPVQGPTPTNHGRNIASPSNYLPEVVAARQTEPSSPPEGRPSGYVLGKRPSIIHEQVEMEASEYERPPPPHPPTGAIGSARPRQYTYGQPAAALEPRQQTHAPQQSAQQAKAIASPAELSAEAPGETPGNGISEEKPSPQVEARQTNTLRSQRTRSKSPVRVTHFGPVQRTLSVRHSPPPRSISPRKSALKQHSPPRSTSSDDTPESTATSPTHDEAAIARKKSVRVSFSDRETVVEGDEPACAPPHRSEPPDAPSPPSSGRRTWFSNIGRSKKKDMSSLDDDEVMKPRPALPSFGSVREKKKPREEEERPLVRPADPTNLVHSPESPIARPSTASPDGGNRNGLGQSSDRAIGGVLSQDFATRIPANTSRFREPLPPVVTSREGSGYISNTDSSSDSDEELLRDTPALSSQPSAATSAPDVEPESKPLNASAAPSSTVVAGPVMAPTTRGGASSRSQKPMTGTAEPGPVPVPAAALPTIAISEPSPGTDEGPKPEPEKIAAVPGGFPDDEYEHTSAQQTSSMQTLRQTQNETRPASASEVALEPISQALDTERTVHAPATVAATHSAVADDSDSDGTSIYSDAYEDLADMGNDGFQSIDAIVGSGVLAKVSANSPSDGAPVKVPDAEPVVQRPPSPVASPAPEVVARAVPFQPLDDWEAAKAFWRSLTADKRAQLEREAAEEAGIEADLEQDAKAEAAKPRRKKSVEKRQAEKRAIQGSAQGSSERVYTIRPGSKADGDVVASPASPVLRKSMRREEPKEAAPTASPVLRKSMRGNVAAEQQRPSTSYASPDAQSQNPSKLSAAPRRPMSSHATTTQAAAGAAHRAHDRTNSDASSQPQRSGAMSSFFPPMLKRRGSTSSESSFRRSTTRRASAAFGKGESGGFAMRRTLRGAASPEPEQAEPSRRFSMRSFSPADSARRGQMVTSPPVSFNNQQRMRSSLRDGKSKYGKAKGDGGGIHMSSIFRPRSSKGKKSSRFDDSSDDEGGAGGSGFRSRFEDSSDDEATALPAPLPALSAKTMRLGASASRPQTVQEEAESPDLPDSDDDKKPAAPVRRTVSRAASSGSGRPSRQGLGMAQQNSRSGRGAALGTSLMKGGANGGMPAVDSAPASPKARRGSFMSTVLRRKKMGSNEPGKIQRGEVMDSAARRDTTLERSAQELSALRTKRRTVSMPMVPTIQRNHSGDVDEDWPLASPVDGEDEEETVGSSRPSFAKRRSLSQGNAISGLANDDALVLAPDNMDDVAPTTGAGPQKKKKRFPALRRMFRLDD